MRALKILVVAMGVLLVIGIVGLGYGIAYRMHHPRAAAPASPRLAIAPHGTPHAVPLPAGATILSAQSDGDRVLVRLALTGGGEELLLLDWRTGAVLSALTLK
jgi:hypothetical protein